MSQGTLQWAQVAPNGSKADPKFQLLSADHCRKHGNLKLQGPDQTEQKMTRAAHLDTTRATCNTGMQYDELV